MFYIPILCFLENAMRLMDSESDLRRDLFGTAATVDVPTVRQVPAK